MPEVKKQLGTQFNRALFDIKTINEEARTIDVVFATETPVLRRNWDGTYYEVLDCNPASVRMDRLNAGAPVLNNHSRYSVTDVLGVVEAASFVKNEGRATLRFSTREDVNPIWEDVKNGITRGISVGYNVWQYDVTEKTGEIPVYRATDWEPAEISLAPIPADVNSGTRAAENTHTVIINSKNNNMPENVTPQERTQQITDAVRAVGLTDEYATELINDETLTVDQARAAIFTKLGETKAKPAAKKADETVTPAPAAATQERASEIVHAVRAAGMDINFAFELIENKDITADGARQAILNKMAATQTPAPKPNGGFTGVIGADEQQKERSAIEFALLNRADSSNVIGDAKSQASFDAAKFRGISLLDAARLLLNQRGISVDNFNKQEMYTRSMSTSDFPNVLSAIANKILRKEYEQTPQTFKALASQQNLPDFKSSNGVQFGGSINFDEVKEGSEFKYGSFAETTDNWKLSTYGKLLKMTRQMMINDDLGAFARIARRIAQGASENESNLFWALITGNVKIGADNTVLFHANHGNLAASGAALDATTMAAARTAMRRQKGLDTKELISVNPKYIVVAPEQEMAADQLLTNITPNQAGQVNPFTAAGLEKLVEVRLTTGPWYVFANNLTEAFTYGYLDGNEGLYTEMRYGFEIDGMEIKARQDFAVKAWDWRGTYKNPGA